MIKKRIRYYFILLFFLLSSVIYSYGKEKEPPFPKPNGPGPYPELPIDGGVAFLLILGIVYGVYKSRR